MEFLLDIFENTNIPLFSAFLLGLMTAISPCPMATNITAIGYIGKEIENKRTVFLNGIFYTLGRAISYTILAIILFFGASQLKFSGFFQVYGEKIIGPFLIIIGILMLDLIKIPFPGLNKATQMFRNKKQFKYVDSLLIGVVFALAFCPYSGVLFFGMLIPMSVASAGGLYLPIVFAVGTGIPVIIFAWLISYSFSQIVKIHKQIKVFEMWFRRVVSVLFIGIGIYFTVIIYL